MPKPGLKYFIGSFLLSLAAVFVAAKAYLVMTLTEQNNEQEQNVETRKIELFAANEENDPILEKYKQLSTTKPSFAPQAEETTTDEGALSLDEFEDDVLFEQTAEENTENTADNIYAANDVDTNSDTAEISQTPDVAAEDTEDRTDGDDLQIADASEAPVFTIPLKHNYNTEENNTVAVTDSADTGKIALASHDVSIYNLGTENQADITEPLDTADIQSETGTTEQSDTLTADVSNPQMTADDPWEVAQTSNKYAAKNSLSVKSEPESADVDLPAQEAEVAYKMQKNILIPIPEDIMNEENLTPQFSTSKENLKLEEELRAKHELPALESSGGKKTNDSDAATNKPADTSAPDENTDMPKKEIRPIPAQIPSDDNEKDFDDLEQENDADEQTSKNLTDSVAAWFSGIKTKVTGGNDTSSKTTSSVKKSASGESASGNSIFQKLLGSKEQEKNIAPSELKITFQPNKAEISGQTLDWLRAFADNTLENENVVVEIRASQMTAPAIQQKRLKLMYKVLADKGVDYHKVNVVFTNREPNSFIIRNVRYASEEELARAVAPIGNNPW